MPGTYAWGGAIAKYASKDYCTLPVRVDPLTSPSRKGLDVAVEVTVTDSYLRGVGGGSDE